jgi:predicted nucleic acid-binding protein
MGVFYFDTSALVKRYVVERGSVFVRQITDPLSANAAWTSSITCVEMVAAFYRRVNMGSITMAAAQSAEQLFRSDSYALLRTIAVAPNILAHAMAFAKLHLLRAYDAVHLATALEYHLRRKRLNLRPLVFLSADQPLNQAALAEGLLVDDPNRYP